MSDEDVPDSLKSPGSSTKKRKGRHAREVDSEDE